MERFEFLKEYVFELDDDRASESKHSFYKLLRDDIIKAEKRLGFIFPKELRSFYAKIGYGFLCNQTTETVDRFMDPGTVADFRLCEDIYAMNKKWEYYDERFMVFFEVNEDSFISIDLRAVNANGICPVYYFDKKIANSLKEFLEKMDQKSNYYI
jgi:hypothetical protein